MRDYFKKMFAPIRKQHIIFGNLVRNFFCKITQANATCFQQVLENYVKARQTNEILIWITPRQMLAATFSTPVVYCKWANVTFLFLPYFFRSWLIDFLLHRLMPGYLQRKLFSAAIPKKSLLNERRLAFETAFFVSAAVTAFIICLNTKTERVIKAHWWLDLRVAL